MSCNLGRHILNELQPRKAPILVAESGMDTFVNELQPWKAHSPMSVTEKSGMDTFANELQPWKAHCPMSETML